MSRNPSRTMSRNLSQKQTDRIHQLFGQIEAKTITREEAYETLLKVFEYLPKEDLNNIEKDFNNSACADTAFARLQTILQENNSVAKFGNQFKEQFSRIFRRCYNVFIQRLNDDWSNRDNYKKTMNFLEEFVSVVVQCKDIRWILKEIDYYFINSDIPCPFKQTHINKATLTSRDNYYYIKQLKEEWDILSIQSNTIAEISVDRLLFRLTKTGRHNSYDNFYIWHPDSNKEIKQTWLTKPSLRQEFLSNFGKMTRRSSVIAARIGVVELFELFVKRGEYNVRDQPLNNTDDLNAAIEEGNIDIVKYILDHECQDEKITFTDKQFFVVNDKGHIELLNFMRKHNGIPDVCPDPSQFKYETTIYTKVKQQEPREKPDASKIKEKIARLKEKYGDGIQFDFPGLETNEQLDRYETLVNEICFIEEQIENSKKE